MCLILFLVQSEIQILFLDQLKSIKTFIQHVHVVLNSYTSHCNVLIRKL